MKNEPARLGRALYARSHQGILSTLSVELGGHPFGSVVTFATDRQGHPLMLISSIAEHTRNIDADARVALTLTEPGDDAQALGRLTLVGRAEVVLEGAEDAAARFYARFPHAAEYHRAHDFLLYRINVSRVRYIGGFGRIHWLETGDLCRPIPFSAAQEKYMVEHMNDDHADAMRGYCRMLGIDLQGAMPRMAAIDAEGFDMMLGRRLVRLDFDEPTTTPDEVRKAMVALVRRSREMAAAI
jgi:putative heme iron utilization protein